MAKLIRMNCPICYESHENLEILSCSHSFCSTCISNWKYEKMTCPICREIIQPHIIRTTRKFFYGFDSHNLIRFWNEIFKSLRFTRFFYYVLYSDYYKNRERYFIQKKNLLLKDIFDTYYDEKIDQLATYIDNIIEIHQLDMIDHKNNLYKLYDLSKQCHHDIATVRNHMKRYLFKNVAKILENQELEKIIKITQTCRQDEYFLHQTLQEKIKEEKFFLSCPFFEKNCSLCQKKISGIKDVKIEVICPTANYFISESEISPLSETSFLSYNVIENDDDNDDDSVNSIEIDFSDEIIENLSNIDISENVIFHYFISGQFEHDFMWIMKNIFLYSFFEFSENIFLMKFFAERKETIQKILETKDSIYLEMFKQFFEMMEMFHSHKDLNKNEQIKNIEQEFITSNNLFL